MAPPATSLSVLAIEGISRPLSLLKSASTFQPWAHERREKLAAIITLTDRLVTAAVTLEALAPLSAEAMSPERLLNVADGCERTRLAFKELRLPSPSQWMALAAGETAGRLSPLADMEQHARPDRACGAGGFDHPGEAGVISAEKPGLFLPGAFYQSRQYPLRDQGPLAALICYVCFIGFDYPGISTSFLTCLVVALSTVGASTRKVSSA